MLIAIEIYLCLGLVVLGTFDLLTKRIRKRLRRAAGDTQAILINQTRTAVGERLALAFTLIAMWIFWPAPIWGAIETARKKSDAKTQDR